MSRLSTLVKKSIFINLAIVLASILICFMLAEITIRSLGSYDPDGNFFLDETKLKPYRLPVVTSQQKIETYLQLISTKSSTLTFMYDDRLGWSPRPNSKSENGYFSYNSAGIRSAPAEYSQTPEDGILRIALFGDSFTHGDEVPYENTWGYYLEQKLNNAGIAAEVLNFGVPGYGMGQVYLRWNYVGRHYKPHLVIFGLQMENTLRNVNIIRPVASVRTGIPFSKPRFTINGDKLELLNSPTIPPQQVPIIMNNIEEWDLVEYEFAYTPEAYQNNIWLNSKLIALAMEATAPPKEYQSRTSQLYFDEKTWDLGNEPAQLVLSIVRHFHQDVEAEGSEFIILRLPIYRDLSTLLSGDPFLYEPILKEIEQDSQIIYPERERLKEVFELNLASLDELFTRQRGGHYSDFSNQLIADVVAEYILTQEFED